MTPDIPASTHETRLAALGITLPEAAPGGIYTEALVGSMGRLNPMLDWNNSADRDVDRLIFSGLIRFDSRGLPQPAQCAA